VVPLVIDPALQLALRASLGLLLASAASHKLRDLARFREVLFAYEILPRAAAAAAAPAVPAVEALLAFSLLSGVGGAAAGPATAALMLAYASAILVNVRRGRRDIDCGCMGPASRVPLGAGLVARNLVLAVAASLLAIPVGDRSLGALDVIAVLASTAALSACWLAAERMLVLAPRVAVLRRRAS